MKTTETLEREHTWITWMTETLEALIARAKAEDALPEEAYELFTLYETFADGRHQDKEEQVLFPELLVRAEPADRAVLEKLLVHHETERAHLARMRSSVFGAVHGEKQCLSAFAREAHAYLDLHRTHMRMETEMLLPMAERILSPADDEEVARGFQELEGGTDDPHGLCEQILSLRRRAGLPRPPAA